MRSRNRWILSSLTGLFLAAATGLSYAAASEEAAAGVNVASDEAAPARHSKIKLVLDHDGNTEHLALDNIHEMAVGESRTLATESGMPVVLTRDADGFEIDLDGRKIRLDEPFPGTEGGPGQFRKRIVVKEGGEGADGAADVMIVRDKAAAGADGHDVVVMRRGAGAEGHAFAFATAGSELPGIPLPVEATIHRLEASAKFQALDAATRATVLEALRESAPKPGELALAGPGSKQMVLEIEG